MLNVSSEHSSKYERKLIVNSDGPSSEFKNQFITGKLLCLLSQHLNLPVSWKYFATSHGKGIVHCIGGAAKAGIGEQVRNKGKGSIVMQNSVDFATVVSKLLPTVKTIQIDEAEIQSTIIKLDPWNIVCKTQEFQIVILLFELGLSLKCDTSTAITVKYDNTCHCHLHCHQIR